MREFVLELGLSTFCWDSALFVLQMDSSEVEQNRETWEEHRQREELANIPCRVADHQI